MIYSSQQQDKGGDSVIQCFYCLNRIHPGSVEVQFLSFLSSVSDPMLVPLSTKYTDDSVLPLFSPLIGRSIT